MIRIDHVFVSRSIHVTSVSAPRNRLTREASDHLPLVVDFRLGAH
jgi:endonuclease/exonuclease/phosphatase family metal-dependent hydrolase